MDNVFTLDVDFKKTNYIDTPIVRQNDSVSFIINVLDDDEPFNLTNITTYTIAVVRSDKNSVISTGSKTGVNQVTFKLPRSSIAIVGSGTTTVQLYHNSGRVSSIDFAIKVLKDPSNYPPSGDDKSLVEMVLGDGPQIILDAEQATVDANQAADNAREAIANVDDVIDGVFVVKSDTEQAKLNAEQATTSANNAAHYANTEGKRAENAVSAIDNIVKDGPVLSVNGKVGLVDVTSEDVNYLPLNAFNEDDPITYYELGITAFRVNLSSNSWLGYTSGYANVETIRNFTSAHGVQRITIYAIDNTTMFYVRTSTGVASSPNWSNPKRIMLESDYATEEGFGVVKVDGETIVINDGVISAPTTEQVDWMYFLGNEYDRWYFNYFNPQNGAYTKNKDNLYIRCEGENERRKFRTGIVNVAKYQTIKVELEGESETDDTSSTIKIILHNTTGSAVLTGDAVTTLTDKIIPRKVYELDVSKLSGEYYLAIMVANTPNVAVETWCKVYKVWGE